MSSTSKVGVCSNINKHPEYDNMVLSWQKMNDCQSEKYVKSRDDESNIDKVYLPKTSGQKADATNGESDYQTKKTRANFPSNLIDTERAMAGLLSKSKLVIEVPTPLDTITESITDNGEDIKALNARINDQQLITSRCGLLVDLPVGGGEPYVVIYTAERILNWDTIIADNDEKPTMVILDVSSYAIDKSTGKWEWVKRCKVLGIDEIGYYTYETEDTLEDIDFTKAPEDAARPVISNSSANEIPFVICNASNTLFSVEDPCLEPLADDSLHYYRNSADYEELLYMQTIAILVRTGFSEEDAKLTISVNEGISSTNPDAKVYFAEVSGAGISESRTALENTMLEMTNKGVALMEAGANESGEALSIRLTTKTTKLTTIAATSAQAIEKTLKIIARWMGIKDNEISISSSDDFTDNTLTVEELEKLSAMVERGLFTQEDFHKKLNENGHTEETFEEWKQKTEQTANMDM